MRNTVKIYWITLAVLILLPAFLGVEQAFATGTTVKTIAVLPVHVNSTQDLDYIKKGMAQMFGPLKLPLPFRSRRDGNQTFEPSLF